MRWDGLVCFSPMAVTSKNALWNESSIDVGAVKIIFKQCGDGKRVYLVLFAQRISGRNSARVKIRIRIWVLVFYKIMQRRETIWVGRK